LNQINLDSIQVKQPTELEEKRQQRKIHEKPEHKITVI